MEKNRISIERLYQLVYQLVQPQVCSASFTGGLGAVTVDPAPAAVRNLLASGPGVAAAEEEEADEEEEEEEEAASMERPLFTPAPVAGQEPSPEGAGSASDSG